jgi:hypothetical protein
VAVRARLMAAEAAELGRQLKVLGWAGAKLITSPLLRFPPGRWLSDRLGNLTPMDPARWSRSERLLVEIAALLRPLLPPGVEIPPPVGRSFRFRSPGGRGGGFVGMPGHADMPQTTPKDLARDLGRLMRGMQPLLQRYQPGWPGTSAPAPAFKTETDGVVIRMWWEDSGGRVVVQLDDLDLSAVGLA